MSMNIPDGWEIVKLKDVVFFQEGPGLRKYQFKETGIPFLNIRTLKDEKVILNLCQYLDFEEVYTKYQHFLLNEGDIVASSSGTLGKTALIYKENLPLMLNTSIIRFRPHYENISTRDFIHLFLKSQYFLSQAKTASTGSAQVNFGPSHLEKMWFILPPLNEQKRIVAKIDALQQHSDRIKSQLEAIKPLLDQFRQSVLSAAFRGDLTRDWREKNPDIEPAEELLKFPTKRNLEMSDYKWIKLKYFIDKIQAGKNFKCLELPVNNNTVGIVKISAVTWGKFNALETKTVDDITKIEPSLFINQGDFLISRANTIELVGASVIVDSISYKIMISDKVWRVFFNNKINKQYVNLYLKSKLGRNEIESKATGNQLSMRNISQDAFKDIEISFCSLKEQQEIVRRIETLFKLADSIEQQYQQTQTQLETLNQSILAKAFRGELVPQDPNDEPASVLLDRIKAEKAQQDQPKRTKKKSSKTEPKQLDLNCDFTHKSAIK
ncbi:hypothetical protein C7H19_08600 [Aphanothece hegewaldii CCALA 016]|uniref:Type I restriction modification DNA specificity domain-containing protein n=1 Tax=Aphanothece hegewaldii CCALA 016 TaxID=2107694 RepID=A0A2T1LYY0_9CHRO|nr:restriction endonuclease subunit S [Aphanothece hegewaldii]PSF37607.1 hypothetical protein C7H19_08600 [Aphanothece hegewaldii CCALA 016]